MQRTNKFINDNAVLFSQANCVLLAQVLNGCQLYVPVNVGEGMEKQAKEHLQDCIDNDMVDNPPPKSSDPDPNDDGGDDGPSAA